MSRSLPPRRRRRWRRRSRLFAKRSLRPMNPFDCPRQVEDGKVRARTVQRLRERKVWLPTFAELADPALLPAPAQGALAGIGPDAPDAANLARLNWFNAWDRRSRLPSPAYLE